MPGYCAVRAAAEPLAAPILAGGFGEGTPALRAYPRSALDAGSWTLADPARTALLARLEAGGAPLGDILLGGVRMAAPVTLDPALLIDARDRRRLLRADRRAARAIRPVVAPEDVVRFGSARAASRFAVAGPLPPRARRLALELGLEPPETDLLPPPRARVSSSPRARVSPPSSAILSAGPSRRRGSAPSPPPIPSSQASSTRRPSPPSSPNAVPAVSPPAAWRGFRSGSRIRTTTASGRPATRSRLWPSSAWPSRAGTGRTRRPAGGRSRPRSTLLSNGSTAFRQIKIAVPSEVVH